MCTRNAYQKVHDDFSSGDAALMAELSGAVLEKNIFRLPYCGVEMGVTYPEGNLIWPLDGAGEDIKELTHEEQIVALQYLTLAGGLPSRGQWLSFLELRGGQLHWLPFQREALEPLARAYHHRKDEFWKKGQAYGGEFFSQGDAGMLIPVFPRIKLAYIIWEGDEEFPPRSVILFDSVSENYLSTATLYVMAIQVMIRIWFPGDTRF